MVTITRLPEKQPLDSIKTRTPLPLLSPLRSAGKTIKHLHLITWLVFLAALVGINLFVHQVALVPQVRDYYSNWYGARWITAPQAKNQVAYYRKTINLEALPTGAFLTVQGSQSYALYIDGQFLERTRFQVESGATNLAHIYDVSPFLTTGSNTIALCVINHNDGIPAVRLVLGLALANHLQTFPSNTSWQATDNASLVDQPCRLTSDSRVPQGSLSWNSPNFNGASWPSAIFASGVVPPDGILHANPAVFETPLSTSWLALDATSDAFFYRAVNLPSASEAWLRVASTGTATIFLNGSLLAEAPPKIADSPDGSALPTGTRLTAGIFDITTYLHTGQNDLAVHVITPGSTLKGRTFKAQPAALLLDMLLTTSDGKQQQLTANSTWKAAASADSGWTTGQGTNRWVSATQTGAPSLNSMMPYKRLATNLQAVDTISTATLTLITSLLLLLTCIIAAGIQCLGQRSAITYAAALDRVALALLPALALLALLYVLSLEPLMPRPFPFTPLWLGVLLGLAVLCLALMILAPHLATFTRRHPIKQWWHIPRPASCSSLIVGLAVGALTLLGLYLTTYHLSYESYWQDELTSIAAAQGILQNGVPHMPSGFIYPKAELYSYLLALVIAIFGTAPEATRSLSVAEYTMSLLLLFFIGRAFFNRYVGVLAMAFLVFSPMALRWGREARMYQQAELCLLLVVYLFYRAVQPGARIRFIYLSMVAVVVMYLSHEETFILLPGMVCYFLWKQRLTWMRNIHWWIAGLAAVAIVLLQLYLVAATHPPIIGTDLSQRPFIAFAPENLRFYLLFLFNPQALGQGYFHTPLAAMSLLALGASIGSLFIKRHELRYLSLLLVVSLAFLSVFFTLVSDRYLYPTLPLFALLAAAVVVWLVGTLAQFARQQRMALLVGQGMVALFSALFIGTLLISQTTGIATVGVAVSHALGLPYQHHYPDYRPAGAYIRAHWQPGDVLITIAPDLDAQFYAEHPLYYLYETKSLFVFEQDGHIEDLSVAATALLNKQDFDAVLAKYQRIWLFSVGGYQCCGRTDPFPIAQHFRLVFEGQETLVYFRSG